MTAAQSGTIRTAGIVSRLAAAAIDVILVGVLLSALYVAWVFLRLGFSPWEFRFPAPSVVFSTLGFLGVALLYLACLWGLSGRTVGAALMGVKVVAADGSRLKPLPALLRAVACVIFPVGLVWVAVDADRRSAQDLLLRTRVVYAD